MFSVQGVHSRAPTNQGQQNVKRPVFSRDMNWGLFVVLLVVHELQIYVEAVVKEETDLLFVVFTDLPHKTIKISPLLQVLTLLVLVNDLVANSALSRIAVALDRVLDSQVAGDDLFAVRTLHALRLVLFSLECILILRVEHAALGCLLFDFS